MLRADRAADPFALARELRARSFQVAAHATEQVLRSHPFLSLLRLHLRLISLPGVATPLLALPRPTPDRTKALP